MHSRYHEQFTVAKPSPKLYLYIRRTAVVAKTCPICTYGALLLLPNQVLSVLITKGGRNIVNSLTVTFNR